MPPKWKTTRLKPLTDHEKKEKNYNNCKKNSLPGRGAWLVGKSELLEGTLLAGKNLRKIPWCRIFMNRGSDLLRIFMF